MHMIDVQRLSFSYPDGPKALDQVSFRVAAGECVGLVGPNGAGKTTLFLCLCGVLKIQPGMAQLGGLDPADPAQRKRLPEKVGIVFQNSDDQIFNATVADDVAFGPLNLGLPADEIRRRVAQSLESVGLTGLEQRVPYHLSGGEKRRTALAGILAMEPSIFLFDEPSMYLDPRGRHELIDTLHKLTGAKIIASHDLELILQTCSRVLVIERGQLVADGPARDILADAALMQKHGLEVPHSLRHDADAAASSLFDAMVAEQRDRAQLAKRLHGTLAQLLVACKMQHGQLRRLLNSDKAAAVLGDIDNLIDEALSEVRTLIGELKDARAGEGKAPFIGPAAAASAAVPARGTLRVLIADDSEWLREAVRRVLKNDSDFAIVGEVAKGEDAVREALALNPDVVLMDVNMPDLDGIEATEQIKAQQPNIVVIGFTVHEDEQVIARMRRAGAAACIGKFSDGRDLCQTIRQVARTR